MIAAALGFKEPVYWLPAQISPTDDSPRGAGIRLRRLSLCIVLHLGSGDVGPSVVVAGGFWGPSVVVVGGGFLPVAQHLLASF